MMKSDAFHADRIPQVPLFVLLVVELVEILVTHEALVVLGGASHGNRRTLVPWNQMRMSVRKTIITKAINLRCR